MTRSRFLTSIISLIFAFLYEVGNTSQTFTVINNNPDWFVSMLPYLIDLVILIILRSNTSLPPSWGLLYLKTGK